MPPKKAASAKPEELKEPKIELLETEENKAAIKNMFERKAELIYGKMRTFNNIKEAKKPYIVWLYGPPGSGKSSPATQKIIENTLGLCTKNAVSISLDALVEGLEPFQRKSANVYRSEKTKEEKASQASRLYTLAWQSKINGDAEKTLGKKRRELFEKAVQYELDILYEFVASGTKDKDDIKVEIFDVLEKSGKLDTYDVYVVYPFVQANELVKRLEDRPARQMASDTPFFRYVSPKSVDILTNNHIKYFVKYIIPRVDKSNLTGEFPVIRSFINKELSSGMTMEKIKEELVAHKDLPGKLKKVVVFENKSANKVSTNNYTKRIMKMVRNSSSSAKTTGGMRKHRKTVKKSSK